MIALASLANGVALLLAIVAGLPLGALLAITWSIAAVMFAAAAVLGGPHVRSLIGRVVLTGFIVGLIATLAYDATKSVLSQLDPSPYDPFEATRIFGQLLIGTTSSPLEIAAVGWAFHLTNGATFAIAFTCFVARWRAVGRWRWVAAGLGWALFLETFQLILYPGWLSIAFIDEFRTISFLSHIVFGVILGSLIPPCLRWFDRRATQNEARST